MTTSSDKSWLAEVTEVEPDYYKKPIVYRFGDEYDTPREFECTDSGDSGVYDGS